MIDMVYRMLTILEGGGGGIVTFQLGVASLTNLSERS